MSIPQTLRTPLAVRALLALAERMRRAGDVSQVLLGSQPKGAIGPSRCLVVFSRRATDDALPVDWEQKTYVETNEIPCTAVSWSGGSELLAHMDECEAVLDALRLLIEADPTLGGVCEQATLGRRRDWTPENASDGSSVALDFTVRVQSYV